MITRLTINNFKAFQSIQLGFSELNLLTGVNGVGKSSVLQSLLLLRQSYDSRFGFTKGLSLKGNLIDIGRGKEAQNIQAEDNTIEFGISFSSESSLEVLFEFDPESDVQPHLWAKMDSSSDEEPLFTEGHFQYLNANRISPKIIFQTSYSQVEQLRSIGKEGEFTVHFLAKNQREIVELPSVCLPAQSNTLLSQVDAWFNLISPGTRLNSTLRNDLDVATLTYQFVTGDNITPEFTPVNVGFGFTYVLPVLVAILSARPGDLILIENPESHLHPRGQAVLGELMASAAQDQGFLIKVGK